MFLNLRHNSFKMKGRLLQMVDQNGGKFELLDCILSKSNFSFTESKFIVWCKEFDKKIKILMIWALESLVLTKQLQ